MTWNASIAYVFFKKPNIVKAICQFRKSLYFWHIMSCLFIFYLYIFFFIYCVNVTSWHKEFWSPFVCNVFGGKWDKIKFIENELLLCSLSLNETIYLYLKVVCYQFSSWCIFNRFLLLQMYKYKQSINWKINKNKRSTAERLECVGVGAFRCRVHCLFKTFSWTYPWFMRWCLTTQSSTVLLMKASQGAQLRKKGSLLKCI